MPAIPEKPAAQHMKQPETCVMSTRNRQPGRRGGRSLPNFSRPFGQLAVLTRRPARTRGGAPTSAPVVAIDTRQRLRHLISYKDSAGNRAKPPGVAYCEIWSKVGSPAPTDLGQMSYLGNASRTPQLEEYPAAQAGQPATYWLRWVSTRGDKGPWSAPVSATIPG